MEDKIQRKEVNSYEVLGYIVIVTGALLIIVGLYLFKFLGHGRLTAEQVETYGQFGQFIGGIVGSLWALAGVLLFIATLTYQKKEFEQQRIELEKTQKIFKQQDFSSLFLNFISQHNSYINQLEVKAEDGTVWRGGHFFILFRNKVLKTFNEKVKGIDKRKRSAEQLKTIFCEAFTAHYHTYENDLEPYLKNLRLLFDIVQKYRNETLDKSDYYSHILKTSISPNELFFIYHIGVFNIFSDLKKYNRIFNLFEFLDKDGRVEYIVEKEMSEVEYIDGGEVKIIPPYPSESKAPISL